MIDVWWIDVHDYRADADRLKTLLSPAEQARAQRFYHRTDRLDFTVIHGICRLILSRYLNQPPEAIRFVQEANGKPILFSPTSRLHFNLTHSGSKALLAIGSQPLGVDMEQMKSDLSFDELVPHFMSVQEQTRFANLNEAEKRNAFYLCWTRKEAYVKAIGQGLSYPVQQVTVSFDASDPTICDQAHPTRPQHWHLYQLPTVDDYTQVVVSRQADASLRLFTHRS